MTNQLTQAEIMTLLRLVTNEKVKTPQFAEELTAIENKLVNISKED